MGRKRRDRNRMIERVELGEGRARRRRWLALLLALAGGAAYLVRRNQRMAEIDEGIWHEAPAPAPASPSAAPTT